MFSIAVRLTTIFGEQLGGQAFPYFIAQYDLTRCPHQQ